MAITHLYINHRLNCNFRIPIIRFCWGRKPERPREEPLIIIREHPQNYTGDNYVARIESHVQMWVVIRPGTSMWVSYIIGCKQIQFSMATRHLFSQFSPGKLSFTSTGQRLLNKYVFNVTQALLSLISTPNFTNMIGIE